MLLLCLFHFLSFITCDSPELGTITKINIISDSINDVLTVDIHGDDLIFGQISPDGDQHVLVYNREDWPTYHNISNPDTDKYKYFGLSVSIHESNAVVGSPTYGENGGYAIVFHKSSDSLNWTEVNELVPSSVELSFTDNFGCSVSMTKDYLFVGANGSQKVFIFKYDEDEEKWNEVQTISEDCASFGWAISAYDDYAIVGAKDSNSAFIYHLSNGEWEKEDELSGSGHFGYSVSIFGEYAIIGAPDEDIAYIYEKETDWVQKRSITQSDFKDSTSKIGESVSIHRNYAAVSSNYEISSKVVLLYRNDTKNEWSKLEELSTGILGSFVSLSQNLIVLTDNKFINVTEVGFSCDGSIFGCGASPNGYCEYTNVCKCNPGYTGNEPTNCKVFTCENRNDCSENGTCTGPNECKCNSGWNGDLNCSMYDCSSLNDCNGNGECTAPNFCQCYDNYYEDYCNLTSCNGINSSETDVCNSRGNCTKFDTCECDDGYSSLSFCLGFACDGIDEDDKEVCSGHGNCTGPNNCACEDGYSLDFCSDWKCFDKSKEESGVCSGHGKCVGSNDCDCDNLYGQTVDCKGWTCYGEKHSSIDACYGNGLCLDFNLCHCIEGYQGEKCSFWTCHGLMFDSNSSCSGHGICYKPETCICKDGYDGSNCSIFSCGGELSNSSKVCSGNGECVASSKCECEIGFSGELCETNNILIASITSGVSTLALVIAIGLVIFVSVILYLCLRNRKQKKKLTRFEKIDGIDILAEEHELETQTGVSFKVNKNLFKVDFEKIKFIKKIGQGGGTAAVYLCKYKDRDLVFKCFSMNEFEDEHKYSEFEKEVSVISSVSHENILRFFGASVKEPRVGYLMQYCENGDVKNFLTKKYHELTGKDYSTFGRVKMLKQISSAMSHLHSLSIIHRDLKCENVLVDSSYNCQVMDFGLSKIYSLGKTMTMSVGTSQYMAPELILREGNYNEKVDVFSFSIMIFEITTGNFNPYGTSFNIERKVAADENMRPDFSKHKNIPEFVIKMAKNGWDQDHENRPSFQEIFGMLKEELQIRENVSINFRRAGIQDSSSFNLRESTYSSLLDVAEKQFLKGKSSVEKIVSKDGTVINEDNAFAYAKKDETFTVYCGGEEDIQIIEQADDDDITKIEKEIAEKDKIIAEKDLLIKKITSEKDREIKRLKSLLEKKNE